MAPRRGILKFDKSFLVSAFLNRYIRLDPDKYCELEVLADSFYDECVGTLGLTAGRKKFRDYCCLTPEALREFETSL